MTHSYTRVMSDPASTTASPPQPDRLEAFGAVEAWVFDLDNTLYPAHTNLFAQIDVRIRDYVQVLLDTSPEEAHRVQKAYYHRYGTSLRGLMMEHGMSPDGFLEYVHDIDHSVIDPDPALGAAIAALPGRKFIYTNGTKKHAEKTAARLGIADHFEDIFDIVAAGLMPKPEPAAYELFWSRHGVDPTRAAMFEDLSKNLVAPKSAGMRTVLVVPRHMTTTFADAFNDEGVVSRHVDHITDDLPAFLAKVLDTIR
jgi:putative hydrolase of the HAD superfamily